MLMAELISVIMKAKKVFKIIEGSIKVLLAQICVLVRRKKYEERKIWIISEKLTEARDNGYYFYKYVKENHPEIESYYVIKKGSPDFKKVEPLGNIIFADSLKHCMYYFGAKVRACSQMHGVKPYEYLPIISKVFIYHVKGQRQINLKHGISKDYSETFDFRKYGFDLYVCGAKPEYEYIKKTFDYPEKNIVLSGFCRFDGLHDLPCPNRTILIMPTFREWLRTSDSSKEKASLREASLFVESEYYKKYCDLLENKQLIELSKKYNYDIVFYLHYTFQPYTYLFEKVFNSRRLSGLIIANRKQFDVQELLVRSAFLVTDFSSVMFDFAYMHKPIVYYQFDELEYREKHYRQGYFDYRRDGFGPVYNTSCDVVNYIEGLISQGGMVEKQYMNRICSFFQPYDNHNCERVFEAVMRLEE